MGASTGGFTDCLLQRGAEGVIAVDTGYGQMDFRLRKDPRVRLLEKTNARYLTHEAIGEFATIHCDGRVIHFCDAGVTGSNLFRFSRCHSTDR